MLRSIKRLVGSSADTFSMLCFDPFFPKERVDPSLAGSLKEHLDAIAVESTPDAQVESEWQRFRRMLREQFSSSPEAFLRQSPARTLLGLANAKSAFAAWRYLRRSPQWARYQAALLENTVGKPIRFLPRPSTSGSQVHHTFHLANFEEKSGVHVEQMRLIVEFGGGYGSMCRQVHRLGFAGKYIIFDLPELSAIQSYFLRSIGVKVLDPKQGSDVDQSGVVLLTNLDDLRELVSKLRPKLAPAMFIATWSISEAPRALRDQILPIVGGFEHFLVSYQAEFGSVDNTAFFKEMAGTEDAGWHHYPVFGNESSRYLIR